MSIPVKTLIVLAAVAWLAAASAAQTHDSDTPNLTGVWIMLVEGHQIGLELEQDGSKVLGVLLAHGQRILLEGTFVDRALRLVGEKPPDGSPAPHGGEGSTAGPIVARLLDDGTLEGELSTNRGRTKWTGERLKKR